MSLQKDKEYFAKKSFQTIQRIFAHPVEFWQKTRIWFFGQIVHMHLTIIYEFLNWVEMGLFGWFQSLSQRQAKVCIAFPVQFENLFIAVQ